MESATWKELAHLRHISPDFLVCFNLTCSSSNCCGGRWRWRVVSSGACKEVSLSYISSDTKAKGQTYETRNKSSRVSVTAQTSASAAPTSFSASTTSSSGSTSSASPSTYAPIPPGDVQLVSSTCPTSGTVTLVVRGSTHANSYNCSEQTNYPENDITMLTAYTMQQCIEACIIHNVFQNNRTCVGVAHSPLMSYRYQTGGGNCFLKDNTGNVQKTAEYNFARLIPT
jgi:hypothetical protein